MAVRAIREYRMVVTEAMCLLTGTPARDLEELMLAELYRRVSDTRVGIGSVSLNEMVALRDDARPDVIACCAVSLGRCLGCRGLPASVDGVVGLAALDAYLLTACEG